VDEMTPMTMAEASQLSDAQKHNGNNQFQGHGPDKQTLGATAIENLLTCTEVVSVLAL